MDNNIEILDQIAGRRIPTGSFASSVSGFIDYTNLYIFGCFSLAFLFIYFVTQMKGGSFSTGSLSWACCGLTCGTLIAFCLGNIPLRGPLMIAKYVFFAVFCIIVLSLMIDLIVKGNGSF